MPTVIYKVTIVYSTSALRTCLSKRIEEVQLPQPIGVRFIHTVTKGNGWEQEVYWFWEEDQASEWLGYVKATAVPNYAKPTNTEAQKKAQTVRMKEVDNMIKQVKKERALEKRRVNTSA